MMIFLAALTQSTPAPGGTAAAATPEAETIIDDMSMVQVPIPTWMIVLAAVLAVLLIALAIFLIRRWLRTRPPPLPISARTTALGELEKLREQVNTLDPYAFSIAVSDVLRKYIGAEYQLGAERQTSPEFLAAISGSTKFSDSDRRLLAEFLEHCDLIKFARIDATTTDSTRLWESAVAFVRGGAV